MSFGLKNAGATYQRAIQACFKRQLNKNVEAYVDDVIVKTRTSSALIDDLEETFTSLREYHSSRVLCPRAYLRVPYHGDPHLLPYCGYLPWKSRGLNTDSWRPPWGHRHDHQANLKDLVNKSICWSDMRNLFGLHSRVRTLENPPSKVRELMRITSKINGSTLRLHIEISEPSRLLSGVACMRTRTKRIR
jgi:hypothetical protein